MQNSIQKSFKKISIQIFFLAMELNTVLVTTVPSKGSEASFCQDSVGAPTCLGGGTCEEHDGTFTCYCPPGLAGDRCQHDLSKHDQPFCRFVVFVGVEVLFKKT